MISEFRYAKISETHIKKKKKKKVRRFIPMVD